MATLVRKTVESSTTYSVVNVGRHTLYKRRWRAKAENGEELAVDLDAPITDGTFIKTVDDDVYKIAQTTEDVLVISLPKTTEMAAKLGWYLGNQHLPVEIRSDSIILEKLDTLAASLDRIGIPYTFKHDVFRCKMHSHQH